MGSADFPEAAATRQLIGILPGATPFTMRNRFIKQNVNFKKCRN
jgi:hypothetical protein